ncbi:MAG: EAL domain-containing protein [Actinobacteria bacterium]|nr:EAL domain-containing protein [Actinomycetota bacterium]
MTELRRFLDATSDGFVALRDGMVIECNLQASDLLGAPVETIVGAALHEALGLPNASTLPTPSPTGSEPAAADVTAVTGAGEELQLRVVAWTTEGFGADTHVLLQDMTAHRRAERQLQSARQELAREATELWHRAFHDPLTNLANRNLLRDRVDHALSRRGAGLLAVMLVDLDGFKSINDALGHAVGDEVLIEVADRLKACVRPSDTVSRPGGDEFAILMEELGDSSTATAAAQRVLDQLAAPIVIDERSLVITASVGIALCAAGDQTVDGLLGNADVALYRAKADGRGCFSLYDPSMQEAALARLELEADLRLALNRGELRLDYQPIGTLKEGRIDNVEALARWTHPTRGVVPPFEFIQAAEDTGLIVQLGEWVLREACRQVTHWHRLMPDVPPVSVAVNVSGMQILQPGFVDTVARILQEAELDPKYLVLEITESLLTEDAGITMANLRGLRDLGTRLSIDDFGTGYSSLARLRAFPVDELKIDRSFIAALDASGDDAPLVAAVIAMAHSLGLEVVGEGVETGHQLEFLRDHACDRIQGYLLARPAPASDITELLGAPATVLRMAAAQAIVGDSDLVSNIEVMEALALAVTEGHDIADVARPLLASVAKITGLESVYLTRIHWDLGEQEILVAHNTGTLQVPAGVKVPWDAGIGGYNDGRVVDDLGFKTYVSVPLVAAGGGRLGTLCGASRDRLRLRKDHLAVMELFGRVLADEMRARAVESLDTSDLVRAD